MNSQEKKLIDAMKLSLQTRNITLGRNRINYVSTGSGKPLILLHGANIGWGQWYPNIAQFAKFFKVFALDLPGSGHSSRIDYRKSIFEKDYIEPIEDFIKKLRIKNPYILGHSVGGLIALKIAIRNKVKVAKIVLVNPIGFTRDLPHAQKLLSLYPFAYLLSKTVMRPTRENIKKFLGDALYVKTALDEIFVDYYHSNIKNTKDSHPFLFIHSLTDILKVKKSLYVENDGSNVKVPVLAILGDKDPMSHHVRVMHRYTSIPGIQIKIFKNTGHVPSLEKRDIFNTLVLNFLKR